MKIIPLIFICLCSFLVTYGQVDAFNKVSLAMRLADASELAKNFNSSVELTLLSDQGSFSKAQAQLVLKDFFSKYTVKSFEMIHSGYSSGSTLFAIGILKTEKGNFRAYFFGKESGDSVFLKEIRLEKETK